MIPDKIYIRHYWVLGELDDKWRLRPVEDEICEEYIRKGALLEWLNTKVNDYGYKTPFRNAIQCTIDKLNSL